MQITLMVLFDGPCWVGVFERVDDAGLRVARVVFGEEPIGPEVPAWLRPVFHACAFWSASVDAVASVAVAKPKQAQREAYRHVLYSGVSSHSQQAMRLELERTSRSVKSGTRR